LALRAVTGRVVDGERGKDGRAGVGTAAFAGGGLTCSTGFGGLIDAAARDSVCSGSMVGDDAAVLDRVNVAHMPMTKSATAAIAMAVRRTILARLERSSS
jgi:hypothetical protein